MVRMKIRFLICVALAGALTPALAAETLDYRVYYKGLLSAMQAVSIADASLVTDTADGGGLEVSTLSLSSAAHEVVDALYPIRYRLRSVHDAAGGNLRLIERFKRTRKVKHDLAWVDRPAGRLHYLKAKEQGPAATLPAALHPWVGKARFGDAGTPARAVPAVLLDRLALLQVLRHRIPAAGQVLTLPVTDGPEEFHYQVRLAGIETIEVGGRSRPAWRLRVEGFKVGRDGTTGEADHAPISMWIGRDAERIPLRFKIEHSVGDFTVDWVPGDRPLMVALDAPIPPPNSWADEG